MQLSEINVTPIKPRDGLVGFASFIINNQLYLGSIGIFTRPQGGYRLVYPTKKLGQKVVNYFHPISSEFAMAIESEVSSKFEEVVKSDVGHYSLNDSRG